MKGLSFFRRGQSFGYVEPFSENEETLSFKEGEKFKLYANKVYNIQRYVMPNDGFSKITTIYRFV